MKQNLISTITKLHEMYKGMSDKITKIKVERNDKRS